MTDSLILSQQELTERSIDQEGLVTLLRDEQFADRFLLVNLLLALDNAQVINASEFLKLMTSVLPGIEQESDRYATKGLIQECQLALAAKDSDSAH